MKDCTLSRMGIVRIKASQIGFTATAEAMLEAWSKQHPDLPVLRISKRPMTERDHRRALLRQADEAEATQKLYAEIIRPTARGREAMKKWGITWPTARGVTGPITWPTARGVTE